MTSEQRGEEVADRPGVAMFYADPLETTFLSLWQTACFITLELGGRSRAGGQLATYFPTYRHWARS